MTLSNRRLQQRGGVVTTSGSAVGEDGVNEARRMIYHQQKRLSTGEFQVHGNGLQRQFLMVVLSGIILVLIGLVKMHADKLQKRELIVILLSHFPVLSEVI